MRGEKLDLCLLLKEHAPLDIRVKDERNGGVVLLLLGERHLLVHIVDGHRGKEARHASCCEVPQQRRLALPVAPNQAVPDDPIRGRGL
eukprot:3889210-Pyramimonas_sp.AAC.2